VLEVAPVQDAEHILQELKHIRKGLCCISFPYSATGNAEAAAPQQNAASDSYSAAALASTSAGNRLSEDDLSVDDPAYRCWGLGQLNAPGLVASVSHIVSSKEVSEASAFTFWEADYPFSVPASVPCSAITITPPSQADTSIPDCCIIDIPDFPNDLLPGRYINAVDAEEVIQHAEVFAMLYYEPRPSAQIRGKLMVALFSTLLQEPSNTFSLAVPIGTLKPGTSGAPIVAFAPGRPTSYAATLLGVERDSMEPRALHHSNMMHVVQVGQFERQAKWDAEQGMQSCFAADARSLYDEICRPLPLTTVEQITPYLEDIVPMVEGGKIHLCMEAAIQAWPPEIAVGNPGTLWPRGKDKAYRKFVACVESICSANLGSIIIDKARVDRGNPVSSDKTKRKQLIQHMQTKKGKKEQKAQQTITVSQCQHMIKCVVIVRPYKTIADVWHRRCNCMDLTP